MPRIALVVTVGLLALASLLLSAPRVSAGEPVLLADNSPSSESYWLQAGAFPDEKEAYNLQAKIASSGLNAAVLTVSIPDKGTVYRVRIGPYKSVEDANRTKSTLLQNGIGAALVRTTDEPKSLERPEWADAQDAMAEIDSLVHQCGKVETNTSAFSIDIYLPDSAMRFGYKAVDLFLYRGAITVRAERNLARFVCPSEACIKVKDSTPPKVAPQDHRSTVLGTVTEFAIPCRREVAEKLAGSFERYRVASSDENRGSSRAQILSIQGVQRGVAAGLKLGFSSRPKYKVFQVFQNGSPQGLQARFAQTTGPLPFAQRFAPGHDVQVVAHEGDAVLVLPSALNAHYWWQGNSFEVLFPPANSTNLVYQVGMSEGIFTIETTRPLTNALHISYPTSNPNEFAIDLPGVDIATEALRFRSPMLAAGGFSKAELIRDAGITKLLVTATENAFVVINQEESGVVGKTLWYGCASDTSDHCFRFIASTKTHEWVGPTSPPLIVTSCPLSDSACIDQIADARRRPDPAVVAELRAEEAEDTSSAIGDFARGFIRGVGVIARVYLRNKPEYDKARAEARAKGKTNEALANLNAAQIAYSRGQGKQGDGHAKKANELVKESSEIRTEADKRYDKIQRQREEERVARLEARDKGAASKTEDKIKAAMASSVPGAQAPSAAGCLAPSRDGDEKSRSLNQCQMTVAVYHCPDGGSACETSAATVQYILPGFSKDLSETAAAICPARTHIKQSIGGLMCVWM